jgi:hypothetical protein
MKMMKSEEPVEPITSPCDSISGYWGLSAKKPVYIGNPVPIPVAGGSVLTQHRSRDTESDGQHNTHDESPGRPGRLLEISYFTGEQQYIMFTTLFWVWGRWLTVRIDSRWYYYLGGSPSQIFCPVQPSPTSVLHCHIWPNPTLTCQGLWASLYCTPLTFTPFFSIQGTLLFFKQKMTAVTSHQGVQNVRPKRWRYRWEILIMRQRMKRDIYI